MLVVKFFVPQQILIMPCPCHLSVFMILQNTVVTLKIQHYGSDLFCACYSFIMASFVLWNLMIASANSETNLTCQR